MLPISKQNILEQIEKAPHDPAVGIQLALLWEEADNSCYSYYGSLIAPNKKIAAHYHNEGDEIYFLIEGRGLMRLGVPTTTEAGVEWKQEFEVQGGDFFIVPPKTVHQYINTSDGRSLAIFGCDKNHLGDDRFVINT